MKKNNIKYFVLMFISAVMIVVFGIFLVFIVNLINYEPEQPAVLIAEPIAQPIETVASSYEPKTFDEPKNIFVTVRPYGNVSEVNVREEPSISSRLVGTVGADAEFIAGNVYETEDFYGFSDIYDNKLGVESEDGVFWISKYYASYSVAGYPEDIDETNSDDVYVKYDDCDHYVVRLSLGDEGESVNVRSCPYTGGYNAYGKLLEGDFYVTTVYQIEGDYLWYGFKADEVAGSNLFFQTKRGNIEDDPDGIVWISSRYVEKIIQN